MIRDGKRRGKLVEQQCGAREGKGLKYRPDRLEIQFLGCPQGGGDFGGVMGIVVGDGNAVDFAKYFKPAEVNIKQVLVDKYWKS